MWYNYFRIAIRSLRSHKMTTLINTVGLSVALMVVIFFLTYQRFENSFEKFHSEYENMYRILEELDQAESGTVRSAETAPPLGARLADMSPDILATTSLNFLGQSVMYVPASQIETREESYNERSYYITDSDFFEVFSFEMIAGDRETALSRPGQVVLTESTAQKYFGNADVVGKPLRNNRTGDLIVSGVLKDPPLNSHLDFDFLLAKSTFQSENAQRFFQSWSNSNTYHYIRTREKVDPSAFDRYFREIESSNLDVQNQEIKYVLQEITDIHFKSADVVQELQSAHLRKRNPLYLNIFTWVTILLILIASVNYINLTTARYINRSREIGIRKIIGASRHQLFQQFMSESMLTVYISGLLAVILALMLRIPLSDILGLQFTMENLASIYSVWTLALVLAFIGLLSGILPAVLLSGIDPTNSLKNQFSSHFGFSSFRKFLVIFQFFVAIGVVIVTVSVYQQLRYIQNRDLGFNQDQLLTIDINSGVARSGFQRFKSAYLEHPDVKSVSVTSRVPGEWKNIPLLHVKARNAESDSIPMHFFAFDRAALSTFGMRLVQGLNFTGAPGADSASVLLNQTAVEQIGVQDPVGMWVDISDVPYPMKIVGVVEDFHVFSLREKVTPVIIANQDNPVQSIDYFTCRINGDDYGEVLAHIENIHSRLDPETPLEYHFLDEQIERFYKEENIVAQILLVVSLLTVFIGCLGLFGLVTYIIGRKRREVGMRKILGSSSSQIWILLSKDIMWMIIISFLLASPLAWYMVQHWLQDFAFSIAIDPSTFILVGFSILALALITIQYHLMQLVRIDPVETLRYAGDN